MGLCATRDLELEPITHCQLIVALALLDIEQAWKM